MEPVSPELLALPKVQLHCHLEGTVRAETFRALAAHHGVKSPRADGPLETTYAFATFGEFLLTFAEVCKVLREPDDFARVAHDYVADAAAQNVRYAEIFISPSVWTYFHRDLDVRATVTAIRDVLDRAGRASGLEVALIVDVTRNFGVEKALQSAAEAIALAQAGLGVIAIGLGGDEANYPPGQFAGAFERARAGGLHCVAHAGEAAGPGSVRAAIEVLGAERIGHGVRAIEDPALVTMLSERSITLEICPTSNRLTGAVPAGEPHPLIELDARGVACAIDADDPAPFGTCVTSELGLVAEWLGWDGVLRCTRAAIEASFASPERKAALYAELATFSLESREPRRTS